jgi:hypothetical protein
MGTNFVKIKASLMLGKGGAMMKNNNLYWLGLVALLTLPVSTLAQEAKAPQPLPTPADATPLEEIPPPALSNDQNADEPQITIVKKKGETIEEYRVNGQLYMMKVTPEHGVPYYLHKEDQEGAWINDGPNQPVVIPKWTIFRF